MNKVTFLGHAGFCVETPGATVIMDPWFSPSGAFDSGWFQLPRNHHLAALVQAKLERDVPDKFVYVSHEHQDHFDLEFLRSLRSRDFKLVIPRYRRTALRRALGDYECTELVLAADSQAIDFDGGYLKLYVDDSELNRDSAILVKTGDFTFLNFNDCRIYDRLREIQEAEGRLDVIASQYSGASWHPTCYRYDEETFERISERKVTSKFETVAVMLRAARPTLYLPTAGPAVFLDPDLIEANFRPNNLFPRTERLFAYIDPVLEECGTRAPVLMPGDVVDLDTMDVSYSVPERVNDENFEAYVRTYAAEYEGYFADRRAVAAELDLDDVFARLRQELITKLKVHTLADRIDVPLFFGIAELPHRWLVVDFSQKTIEECAGPESAPFYRITAPAASIAKVLAGRLTWEEFGLSLRARLERVPDIYQPLIHAFLTLDAGDIVRFCSMTRDLESRTDRIDIEVAGCSYSILRYCPHNGGDLAEARIEEGRYVVCPRHGWRFDLDQDGRCTTNETSIRAEAHSEKKAHPVA